MRCPAPPGSCAWRLAQRDRRWQLEGMTRHLDLRRALAEFCAREHGAQTRLLSELVKVPSDNPPGDCARHAERAAALLEDLGLERAAAPGARAPGAGERHGQRDQPDRARALRRGPDDRAERARRRGAAGRGLVHRSLRRRDPGRLDVWPRRGGVEERFRHLCLRPAGAEVARPAARRYGRAASDLRRGSGRGDRAEVAARSRPHRARLRDQRRLLLRHRHRAQRLPASRGRDHRQVGARRSPRDRARRARGGGRACSTRCTRTART